MIYCMGLPRSGGQTLKHALRTMLGPDWLYYHSIATDGWAAAQQHATVACIEVFAPVQWCLLNNGHRPHCFIVNRRYNIDDWVFSMESVRERAVREKWSHPIWKYEPSQWREYETDYYGNLHNKLRTYGCKRLWIDITQCGRAGYHALADLLNIEYNPDWRWPWVDEHHGRLADATLATEVPFSTSNRGV